MRYVKEIVLTIYYTCEYYRHIFIHYDILPLFTIINITSVSILFEKSD